MSNEEEHAIIRCTNCGMKNRVSQNRRDARVRRGECGQPLSYTGGKRT